MPLRGIQLELRLNFLIYPSDEKESVWVAHCLELDVVAQEATQEKAIILLKELIEDLIDAALADDTLPKIFKSAPPRYWEMALKAKRYRPSETVKRRHITGPIPVSRVDYLRASRPLAFTP